MRRGELVTGRNVNPMFKRLIHVLLDLKLVIRRLVPSHPIHLSIHLNVVNRRYYSVVTVIILNYLELFD